MLTLIGTGIISLIFLIAILLKMYFISMENKLRKLYTIYEKLPGLRDCDFFKEYEELFEKVRDSQPGIPILLGRRINWLIELSESQVADMWQSDEIVENEVFEIFVALNEYIRHYLVQDKQRELEKFRRMIEK